MAGKKRQPIPHLRLIGMSEFEKLIYSSFERLLFLQIKNSTTTIIGKIIANGIVVDLFKTGLQNKMCQRV